MFDNITIVLADLQKHRSDISNYLHGDSFENELTVSEKEVYRKVKSREGALTSLTDETLVARVESIRDFSDTENIKDKICLLVVSKILDNNRAFEEAKSYRIMSDRIPLDYYIDENSNSEADDDEFVTDPGGVTFSR